MCRIVEGVVWKQKDGYGRIDLSEGQRAKFFVQKSFCVYIGRCWQYTMDKNSNTLSTDHSLF